MNINEFQSKVLAELAEIKNLLADNSSAPSKKERKPRKPRDPDAPPNPWIVFTGRVRAALKAAGKPAGKECQQFASYLKTQFPEEAYSMEDSEIMAAHSDWTPPPPKPKEAAEASSDAVATDDAPKPKPKRTLSDEQKAKMAAGRKAAAERKKAEAAAKEVEKEDGEVSEEEAPAPAPAPKPAPALRTVPFAGKKHLWDPTNNGMWLQNADGSKGEWQGVLKTEGKKKEIDRSAKDYTA